MHTAGRRGVLWLCVAFVSSGALAARAADRFWIDTAGGSYTDTGNWSTASGGIGGASVPTVADDAIFPSTGTPTFTVSFPGRDIIDPPLTYASNSIKINRGSVTFADSGNLNKVPAKVQTNSLVVSAGGSTNELVSTLADFESDSAVVGSNTTSNAMFRVNAGKLTLTGATSGAELTLGSGASAKGTFFVRNGADVIVNGSSPQVVLGLNGGTLSTRGTISVDGAGSTFVVNNAGEVVVASSNGTSGALNVTGGGSASDGTAILANGTSTDASAIVDGAGSTWSNSTSLTVGRAAVALVSISNGGQVATPTGTLSELAGANGSTIVDGTGSLWNANTLEVGRAGQGSLTVRNGGAATDVNAFVARAAGSVGTASVSDMDSSWAVSGRLSVGGDAVAVTNGGTGSVSINPGGSVSVGQELTLFPGGTLQLQGGALDVQSVAFQGAGGQFQAVSGLLHVGVFHGNLLNQGATLAPGHSAGDVVITGNYTQQASGVLEMEIGGVGQGGQYDFVNVAGSATVDGQLALKMLNNFVPAANQTFTILTSAGLLGFFDNAGNGQRVATTDGKGSFVVHYGALSTLNPNHIVLTDFIATLNAGDYNGDGVVNTADYTVWRNRLGTSATLPNDTTPGMVTTADYQVWVDHFGATPGSGAGGSSNVAEPTSGWVVGTILVAGLCKSRRHKRLARGTPA